MDQSVKELLIGLGQLLLAVGTGLWATSRFNKRVAKRAQQAEDKRIETEAKQAQQAEAERLEAERAFRLLLTRANNKIDQLENRLASEQERSVQLDTKLLRLQAETDACQKRVTELEQQAKDDHRAIEHLTQRVKDVTAERDTALALVQTRNGELKHREEQIAQLTADLNQTKEELERVSKRVAELEKKPLTPADGEHLDSAAGGA